METAASWAPCTSRGRCEASRSPGPARSHGQAAPNLAGAGSPRPGRARRPCASLPLLRPRAPGHAAPSGHSARPVSTRPQVRGHGHRLPQLRHHGALRQPVLGAHFALDSFQLSRRRTPFGRGRVSALPLSAARLGVPRSLQPFGPHPPESSKPLPLARPGLGMAPRPEAHEPIRHLCEPLKCHGDKGGSQVQKGSLEGVRMNASETLQDVPDGDAPAVSWYHGAGSPRRLGTSIAAPAQPPKHPFLCRLCLWQGEEGTHLTWDTLGTQTSRPEAARGWPRREAVRGQVRATRPHENTFPGRSRG